MADTHQQINHDGTIANRKTVLWPSTKTEQKAVIQTIFQQKNWQVLSVENQSGSFWKVKTECLSKNWNINLYISSIRDESRQPDEYKMQLGTSYPVNEEADWLTVVLGIYTIDEGNGSPDYILSGYDWRGYDFAGNPSLRGTRTIGLQRAYLTGMYQIDNVILFRPEFIYYYLDKIDGAKKHPILEKKQESELNEVSIYQQFITAIRTKPFLLLAGISGTGKSRIVRKLAQATVTEELQKKYDPVYSGTDFQSDRWNLHKPANFELIQVKPNWHNSMDVVGYLSNIPAPHYVFTPFIEFVAKAWQNPEIPFFLCLDEMNLAPVEEYFAEFLSAIESRSFENEKYLTDPIIKPFKEYKTVKDDKGQIIDIEAQMINDLLPKIEPSGSKEAEAVLAIADHFKNKGLTLPQNLIVIGTVNMDETTFSFSRKVLDRAMSIEMNEVDYDMFLKDLTDDGLKTILKDFDEEKYGKGVTLNDLLVNRHIDAKEITGSMQQDAQFVIKYLTRINKLLDGTPFKLGYRAANEAIIYVKAAEEFGCGDIKTALDNFTIMKILSRLEGDESKLTVLENEKRLADANLNVEKVKEDGKITLLTCLREIIKQELGTYTTKNAISTESEDNIGEGAEKQESDNIPQDEDSENNDTSEQAIEETESNAVVPTNAVNSINENSLKSVAKLDSMIIQLHRDHFVSYWN